MKLDSKCKCAHSFNAKKTINLSLYRNDKFSNKLKLYIISSSVLNIILQS